MNLSFRGGDHDKMKNDILKFIFILVIVLIFSVFVYPTMYKFDKINQNVPVKINRITGHTELLTPSGWKSLRSSTTVLEDIAKSLNDNQVNFETNLKQDIIDQIKKELANELNEFKKAQLDPKNYFTIGSTTDEVKKIMGLPDSIHGSVWAYGRSKIYFNFDDKGLTDVFNYDNADENLKIR